MCSPKQARQHAFEAITQCPSLTLWPNNCSWTCLLCCLAVAQIYIGGWWKRTLKSASARWCAAASILTTAARYVSKTCRLHCHITLEKRRKVLKKCHATLKKCSYCTTVWVVHYIAVGTLYCSHILLLSVSSSRAAT